VRVSERHHGVAAGVGSRPPDSLQISHQLSGDRFLLFWYRVLLLRFGSPVILRHLKPRKSQEMRALSTQIGGLKRAFSEF
jgi:hypothetical protein